MVQLLLWMIMAYGISNILVYGSIFNGPRNFINEWGANEPAAFSEFGAFLSKMLACMMCCSVWVGFFYGIFLYSPVHELLGVRADVSWFFDGMLSSGAVWAINSIIGWFEQNRPTNNH